MITVVVWNREDIHNVASMMNKSKTQATILNWNYEIIAYYSHYEGYVSSSYYGTEHARKVAMYRDAHEKVRLYEIYRS